MVMFVICNVEENLKDLLESKFNQIYLSLFKFKKKVNGGQKGCQQKRSVCVQ